MKLEIHSDRSWSTTLFIWLIRPYWQLFRKRPAPKSGSPRLTPKYCSDCDVTERKRDEIYTYDLVLKGIKSKPTKRVLYYPGGAFLSPGTPFHFRIANRICKESHGDTMVTIISYPLAPLEPAPKTYPRLVELYKVLAREAEEAGQNLIVSGDSAGGNLALSLPLHILSSSAAEVATYVPKKIVAIVPACSFSTDILSEVAQEDPILTIELFKHIRQVWATSDIHEEDPRVAPLYADVSVLKKRGVKVYITTAGEDCCAPGALLLQDRLMREGVDGVFAYWPRMMHLSFALFGVGFVDFNRMSNVYFSHYKDE